MTSFSDADEIIVSDIYAAREAVDPAITSDMLAEGIAKTGKPARHISGMQAIVDYLKANTKKDDVVITIGAGDIFKVGDLLLAK